MYPDNSISQEQLTPAYIAAGVILLCIVTVLTMRHLHQRHHHFKNLERRILEAADDVDEAGEHYFIMRTSEGR